MPNEFERRALEKKRTLMKEAINEVLREWLDNQFATFGKWSMRAIAACLFVMFIHVMLKVHLTDLSAFFDATSKIMETVPAR